MGDEKFILKLSPNVRLRMTFEREMSLDDEGSIFTTELHQKFISMHGRALTRQDALLKGTFVGDALLALLLFGKNITIPGTSIGIQDLPAAVEVLTIFASFSFMMLSLNFVNTQAYQAIVEQFTIRQARTKNIDPDFLTSADVFTELYLKIFRREMNIFGPDFFDAGWGFRVFYGCLLFLMGTAMLSVLLLHLSVVAYGVWTAFAWNWISPVFCVAVILMNVVGILVNLAPSFAFTVGETAKKT